MTDGREVVVTGVGMLSGLGEGLEATWDRLVSGPPSHDLEAFAPFVVHRLGAVSFDLQIPKKGDQRQMEPWQRIGVYAAGLALASAGVKGDAALLDRTDMIVAAGGGERDVTVDGKILTDIRGQPNPQAFINERLMNDLRPTLFLAQLPNLVAGSISIVHGVVGSSRTFIGEESAGVDAVRVAHARIAAGQSDLVLVGGGYNAERLDIVLNYELACALLRPPFRPVWDRGPKGGIALGSFGAFLVLEAREHADARGATALARLTHVVSGRTGRAPGDVAAALSGMWAEVAGAIRPDAAAVLSGASGAEPATGEERTFLASRGLPVRATGTHIGHGFEAQFTANLAIATETLRRGELFPGAGTGDTGTASEPVSQVAVTGVGHWRGEGLALVERA
jgi:3-oxoacyl-[acyl-carrier-protein] synthase II